MIYAQVRGPDGRPILQRVDRLTADEQAALLDSPDLMGVAVVDETGATVEDARTGKLRRNGQEHTGPSIKQGLKDKLKPATGTSKGAKPGA